MNAKKAKAIRKFAKQQGLYDPSKPTEYKRIEHQKMVHYKDPQGVPQMVPVTKLQLINVKKYGVKQLKKAFKNGQLDDMPSFAQMINS